MHWWPGLGAQIVAAGADRRTDNDGWNRPAFWGRTFVRVAGPNERQRERQNSNPNQLFPRNHAETSISVSAPNLFRSALVQPL